MQIAAVTVSKAMVYWTGNFGLQIIDTTQGSLTGVPAISDQPMSLTVTARNLTGTLCAESFMLTVDQFPRLTRLNLDQVYFRVASCLWN